MSHESGPVNAAVAPRSRLYQGPFGRIFDDLDPWVPNGVLRRTPPRPEVAAAGPVIRFTRALGSEY